MCARESTLVSCKLLAVGTSPSLRKIYIHQHYNKAENNFFKNIFIHNVHKLPLLKVSIEDSAWETFSANSDSLQYTVTAQLVDDQKVLHKTWKNRSRDLYLKTFLNRILSFLLQLNKGDIIMLSIIYYRKK